MTSSHPQIKTIIKKLICVVRIGYTEDTNFSLVNLDIVSSVSEEGNFNTATSIIESW